MPLRTESMDIHNAAAFIAEHANFPHVGLVVSLVETVKRENDL